MTRYFRYDGNASQYRMRDAFAAEPGDVVEVDDDDDAVANALEENDDFTEVDSADADEAEATGEGEGEGDTADTDTEGEPVRSEAVEGEAEGETSPMAGTQPEEEGEPEPGTQAASESEAESPEEGDFTQDDGSLDVTAWRTPNYRRRVELVESGAMDDHLEEIGNVETSDNVLDAVEERQNDAGE